MTVTAYFRSLLFCLLLPSMAAAVEIAAFTPQGAVHDISQAAATFSTPMVHFGDGHASAPFDVSCPVPGNGRWLDPQHWVYDFKHSLPAGLQCRFTPRAGLVALDGSPVTAAGPYAFSTGGPAILTSEPYAGSSGIDENPLFLLALDTPARADSIARFAYCRAAGIAERIPVDVVTGKFRTAVLRHQTGFLNTVLHAYYAPDGAAVSDQDALRHLREDADSPVAVLRCKRTLPNGAAMELVWDAGILSTSGLPNLQPQTLAYSVRPRFEATFSCRRVNEAADCLPVSALRLDFTAPVALQQAEQVRLVAADGQARKPEIDANDRQAGYVETLRFSPPFPERAGYRLELPSQLTDDAGRPLANRAAFPLTVRTDAHPPLAKFAARFGILEANATTPPLLPLTLRNLEPDLAARMAAEPVPGKVLRAEAGTVLAWLKKVWNSDDTRYDPETGEADPATGPGKRALFAAEDAVQTLTLPRGKDSKAFEVVGLPLPGLGFYVVEVASPRLGQALHGTAQPYFAHAAALVTNLSVHFKLGRTSSLVWVTSLDRGKPVPGAEIEVRDCQGKRYFSGRSDRDGLLRVPRALPAAATLPGCFGQYDSQYFVTARKGEDFSFVLSDWNEGIALWRFNAFQNSWEGEDIQHAVLDRTLLRAGETLHAKLLVRRKTPDGFGPVTSPLPKTLTIRHEGSGTVYELPLSWQANGSAAVDWTIPREANQGSYTLETTAEVGAFRVASFRVPTMQAQLQAAGPERVRASEAALDIQVNYLAGGAAALLPVTLRGQVTPRNVSFAAYPDFTFANGAVQAGVERDAAESVDAGEGHGPRVLLAEQEMELDAAGAGHARFRGLTPADQPQTLEAELAWRDPNGETLTAATAVPLWPAHLLVGLQPDGWLNSRDRLRFRTLVVDLQGKPVTGVPLVVRAFKREYFSHRRRLIGGFYAFDSHSELSEVGPLCTGASDARGELVCDLKPPVSGNLILQAEVKDADGHVSVAHRDVWVAGETDGWFEASDNDRIDLIPEKSHYAPGETARFQLRMPFREAEVLVTLEREGVLDQFVTHVSSADPTLSVPLKGSYAPNVFVSALAVRGRNGAVQPTALVDLGKPAFKMGLAEIKVGWAAHALQVKVRPDKPSYRTREQVQLDIEVHDSDGQPPAAGTEVMLAAVDEGLLALKDNESWAVLEHMMTRRGIEVETATAQMQVVGKRHFGRKALPAGGGGGSGKPTRELFDTLLFWQASVKLDAQGRAQIGVPLNDSLTAFRIVAIAQGPAQFGTGTATVQAHQDLMLFSGLPQQVREGDRFLAGFTVHNAGAESVEAEVSAVWQAGDERHPLPPQHLTLAAGSAQPAAWEVKIPGGQTQMTWDVKVRAGVESDHLKVGQRILPALPLQTLQATLLQLAPDAEVPVAAPAGALPGRGGLRITLYPSLGHGLQGIRDFMSRYPYSCLEQQASVAVALQDRARWDALMQKLPAYLDSNGLARYFPSTGRGSDTLSAYLLALSDSAGYPLPAPLQTRLRGGLEAFVEGRILSEGTFAAPDLVLRKLAAIEALSRSGPVAPGWLDSIVPAPQQWPTSALLDWIAVLQRAGDSRPDAAARAATARNALRNRMNLQGSALSFGDDARDNLWWLMSNGDVNAVRSLLLLQGQPEWRAELPRLLRGVLARQQQGHWRTTVANAWGVLALQQFAAAFEAGPVDGTTVLALGGSASRVEWPSGGRVAERVLPWPAGPSRLSLRHEGNGQPWALVQSQAAVPLMQPRASGYALQRTLLPVRQKVAGSWHVGDVVRVRIESEATADMSWVVVSDPLPAGATVLGSGLGGDSRLLQDGTQADGQAWPAFREQKAGQFNAYYRWVPKGRFAFDYTVRLNQAGTFSLPPTRVEAMYAPEMFGALPNDGLVVQP